MIRDFLYGSVSAVILDRRHDGKHAGEKGTVVDGAGSGEVQSAGIIFTGGITVTLYFGDDGVFVVAHEGEGSELTVDSGLRHVLSDFLHGDGGTEIASCQIEIRE